MRRALITGGAGFEAMRALGVTRMGFVSSGSVYGVSEPAGEGMLQAYCHGFGFTGVVFRFVSILGERYQHGHVIDFWRALRRDSTRLRVLGDGRQTGPGDTAIYNLGTDETVLVDDSAALIADRLGVTPAIEHTGGWRRWPGDAPCMLLDCTKLRALGWAPTLTIEQAIARTVDWLEANG